MQDHRGSTHRGIESGAGAQVTGDPALARTTAQHPRVEARHPQLLHHDPTEGSRTPGNQDRSLYHCRLVPFQDGRAARCGARRTTNTAPGADQLQPLVEPHPSQT